MPAGEMTARCIRDSGRATFSTVALRVLWNPLHRPKVEPPPGYPARFSRRKGSVRLSASAWLSGSKLPRSSQLKPWPAG